MHFVMHFLHFVSARCSSAAAAFGRPFGHLTCDITDERLVFSFTSKTGVRSRHTVRVNWVVEELFRNDSLSKVALLVTRVREHEKEHL